MINRPPSAKQIKAARVLLDWSQEDLAHASRLSIATIRKLELGHISPRRETTRLIYQAVENAGLEFIDADGVRRRLEDITIFSDVDGIDRFFDDIKETVRSKGENLLIVANNTDEFETICGKNKSQKLEDLLEAAPNLSIKFLLTEVVEPQHSTPRLQFRTISKQYVDSVSFYVYGDKYAVIPPDGDTLPKIIAIKSVSIAESFRRQFLSLWEKATPGYIDQKIKKKKSQKKPNISKA